MLLLLACAAEDSAKSDDRVAPLYDPDRSEHYFDLPFPSDTLRDAAGFTDLTGFPEAPQALTAPIVAGWATRAGGSTQGFGANTAAYVRFGGAASFPTETDGLPTDPFFWVDLESGTLLPLAAHFVEDPKGDPWYGTNTLAFGPALGHPARAGARYAAVILSSDQVRPAEGYTVPEEVTAALDLAGVTAEVAVATVFTVQDAPGELQALVADADRRGYDWSGVTLRRVVRLQTAQGETSGGDATTLFTAVYEDGSSETTMVEALDEENGSWTLDLGDDWPMVVYEADVPVYNYQGLEDQPYMSPGIGHLSDVDRTSGWIRFEGGALVSEPVADFVRVTISLPKGEDGSAQQGAGVFLWDHGTGGHAYNAVQRKNQKDDGLALAEAERGAGFAILGRDAVLYGQRYPLMEAGFTDGSLGFYNIVNLTAFRDNQRQTAIEGHQLRRFVEEGLNELLPEGSVDPSRMRRGGHSLGSVTANLGTAAESADYDAIYLSGSGGVFAHYFLDTGLLADLDPSFIELIYDLVGQPVPDEVTPATALGALLGLEEEAWANIDRLHPVIGLFQWVMDAGDPMSVAEAETTSAHMLICVGDRQVPNFTSDALLVALPEATSTVVSPTADDYDPHSCLHREDVAQADFADWLNR